eukprot:XP_020394565.1 STIP1 homology and U box-containing protein 1 isoform X2 [Zea mays]
MAAGGDGVARQAELRRIEGNICFKKARLGAAIDCYTEAIALCPDVAVYWINRALCHFKRKEWAKVEEDSRRALALDYTLVKGHYLLGCALLEKEESALAIKEFEKVLAKAKYLDWEKHSTERLWRMESLKEACETALQEHHFLTGTLEEDSNRSDNEYSEQIKLLSEVFSQATVADTPTDVPDYLCCQITFEIFRDPVITPSGVTYERAVLVEHLHKVCPSADVKLFTFCWQFRPGDARTSEGASAGSESGHQGSSAGLPERAQLGPQVELIGCRVLC